MHTGLGAKAKANLPQPAERGTLGRMDAGWQMAFGRPKRELLSVSSSWPMLSHSKLGGTYSKRACTYSSLCIVVQSDSDGVLQRHRMTLCPRRLKRLLPKCPAGRSRGALVFDALGRWERPTPILAQRGGCPTQLGCPLHPPLRDRNS